MGLSGSRIFVTGGAGFIGSHITESLVRAGARVTVYDNFRFGMKENLSKVLDDVSVIEGDILDYDKLSQSIRGHSVVSHHAAQLEILLGVASPLRDLEVNTIGTLNVLRASKEQGIDKIINASSACIYGQTDEATHEDHLPVPNWEYGVSKLAAERYATIYSRYRDLPTVSLRYAITYGEREWFRRALTVFLKRAIQGKPIVVFGDGEQVRDLVYVADAVAIHNKSIECDEANGQSYNVGTGIATSIMQLATLVADTARAILGTDVRVVHEELAEGETSKMAEGKRRNVAELKTMLLDVGKAGRELGWRPVTPLAEGIKREMLWAAENLDRWSKITYSDVQ